MFCGEFISATTRPLLRELRLDDRYGALAGPEVRRVGLNAGDTVLAASMPASAYAAASWGRAVGREHFDLMLLDAAVRAGATVWQPWTVAAMQRTECGHACRVVGRGGEQMLAADVVIAAHGSWERGPLPAQDSRSRARTDLIAFKAHFSDSWLPVDLMPLLSFAGGYAAWCIATAGGRACRAACGAIDSPLPAAPPARERGRGGHSAHERVLRRGACRA